MGRIFAVGLSFFIAGQSLAQSVEGGRMEVAQSWSAIERWLVGNAPALRENLNPPALIAQIERAEFALGMKFPPSVRLSYLVHNGESRRSAGLFGLWRWLPLEEVIARHAQHKGIDAFRPDLMIPLVESPGGDMLYVEASHHGSETPVIEWWHENPTRDVKHESFAHFFAHFVARLKRNEYVFRQEQLGLIDKDDL